MLVILLGPLDESLEIANNENCALEGDVLLVNVLEQSLFVFGHLNELPAPAVAAPCSSRPN